MLGRKRPPGELSATSSCAEQLRAAEELRASKEPRAWVAALPAGGRLPRTQRQPRAERARSAGTVPPTSPLRLRALGSCGPPLQKPGRCKDGAPLASAQRCRRRAPHVNWRISAWHQSQGHTRGERRRRLAEGRAHAPPPALPCPCHDHQSLASPLPWPRNRKSLFVDPNFREVTSLNFSKVEPHNLTMKS